MKKFGYIYKYNPSEGMGILVYGVWKVRSSWGSTIKNTPILFSDNDLLSEVSSGKLVFFDLNDDKTVSNIERASLSNFKVDYINSLITCKSNESEYSFYDDNTYISFERLDNIIIPNEDDNNLTEKTSDDDDLDLFDFDLDDFDDFADTSTTAGNDLPSIIEATDNLHESIKELFNCFGKYKHKDGKESTSLNVFDLSLWIDTEVENNEYYGTKVDELIFLYNLFVLKKRYNKNGYEIPVKRANDCISPLWSFLLSKFNEEDLKKIVSEAPILQPALPVDFCKNNPEVLTDDYGMPNVEICKSYCLCQISNADNISDYKDLKHKLYVYRNCTATHLEGEGTPMCKMGKTRIRNLEKRLEEQYENVIKKNVIAQLSELSDDVAVVEDLKYLTPDEFQKVGVFIDSYNNLRSNFFGYEVEEKILNSYEGLSESYRNALRQSLLNCINESAISATQLGEVSPFILRYQLDHLGSWILESTKLQIKSLVNERFSKLDDLEDLREAYKADYITEQQYDSRYKEITSGYEVRQFLKELSDYKIDDAPIDIQWYVVSNIVRQLGYKSLGEYRYCQDFVYDIRSLLKYLASYGNVKDIVLKKAEEEICSVLSDDERWTLFEEKIVKSPGTENIRKRLDEAYKKKYANKELFKHACFQDVMLSDVDSIKDSDTILFIADNLDARHQNMMQQKASGFLKLYLWQKQPSDDFDWDLIKTHFYELSAKAQIRVLRYIFGKMATGNFPLSLDDIYSEFVETNTQACSAICGILFMLKAKKNDLNVSITPSMLESVIGKEEYELYTFLKDSRDLFYPCNGYLAISANKQDIDYQTFYGFLTKDVKNDELYYVIHFYDSPVDLFGRTIDWLLDSDYIETAKQVLLKNTNVEVIKGNFYIHESLEYFVKQFVIAYDIDDKCGLVSDKEWMIEQGYLPRNNAYQPLYTNYIRVYDESDYYVCRCGSCGGSDPHNNIPFFWCNKKMCVRRAHFLQPPSQWEKYHFADLLFIALGQSSEVRESIWRVNSEISQFICDYKHVSNSDEKNICSKPLNETEERGTWDESSSIYREIYDDEDDDEYNEDYEDYSPDQDEPTYDRYNGSYAQDEMGYSDDEIDTIFDGDPDAYWNID